MSVDSAKVGHLCVLVHGLWGNPSHLDYLAAALKERHGDELHTLCPSGNSGNNTYDGVDVLGERVVQEIEAALQNLEADGHVIKKISLIGYSLGGLVARYAIGILQANGWLDKLEPVNFTTFASPHVGARTPLKGFASSVWNGVGPSMISASGQQMFMVDSFRDTGRPLFSVMADRESVFIQGLKRFPNRSLYANVVNDRITSFFSTAISKTDPFQDLDNLNINYVEGYERVIINCDQWLLPQKTSDFKTSPWKTPVAYARQMPLFLLAMFILPPALTAFVVHAAIQTVRSRKRIRLHGEGQLGALFKKYRVPLLVKDAQHAMEEVLENVNATQEPAYLSSTDDDDSDVEDAATPLNENNLDLLGTAKQQPSADGDTIAHPPKLALTPEQFEIIDSLNGVGFHKYPVYIHTHHHSHAAIVVRIQKDSFWEGKIVVKHWLDNEFKA
ncbi:hypothetical protein N7468_004795 [Penicillium chermesinum]|uniref:DUF676 domain-containing protein n=1 Tax=Penicillium chermesinum TaxID=63820 RepID=A0A9W9P9W3_9EURO|nr:uncharacterized protein N7468_004795 [Penicillium chermesinum]KAJ5240176.1 hypothetical protein N7468_004795 [Penicillium chermesinum]KAJ6167048.1 hypothetical protein N7470_002495 [Penicillium chermesinum]